MEHNHILLLQLVVATFEGNEDYYDLLNECDKHILLHANGPEDPPANLTEDQKPFPVLTGAAKDLQDALDAPYEKPVVDWSREVPERLAELANAEPRSSCKGCMTPNPERDPNGNCEICGYPGIN